MRVEYRWLDGTSWFKPMFLLVWGLGAIWVGTANYLRGDTLIPIVCLVLLLLATYVALASFFNSTTLIISPTELEIFHGPLPWFGDRVMALDAVESLSYKAKGGGEYGRYYSFYCNRVDKKRHSIFFGVDIPNAEPAIKSLTKVIRWLEPYRRIPLVNENPVSDR